jgi:hypothetical protein
VQKIILSTLCCLYAAGAFAQSDFRAFAGAGYGLENRIGFHGITVRAGGQWAFSNHLSGIASLEFFYSNRVPKWGDMENAGAYFRQVTPSIRLQYSSGEVPGTGLLLSAGLGLRKGQTYHFESGDYHNGTFTNPVYITEPVKGSGLILGLGYGFPLAGNLLGRIEFNNHAFLMLNDQYSFSFQLVF